MADAATPGWYHAEGDPDGTERFWDGSSWTEGPRPIGGTPDTSSFGMETPSADAPDTSGCGMETPSVDTPDTSGFGASAPTTPQDGFGAAAPVAAAGGFASSPSATPPPGFPGAPGGAGAPQFGHVYPEESKAQTALIVAVVGIVLCGPVAIIGGVMGNTERKAIEEGRRDPANKGMATAAFVIGIISAIFTVLAILFVIVVFVFAAAGG